jgi:hypothetical protein
MKDDLLRELHEKVLMIEKEKVYITTIASLYICIFQSDLESQTIGNDRRTEFLHEENKRLRETCDQISSELLATKQQLADTTNSYIIERDTIMREQLMNVPKVWLDKSILFETLQVKRQ